ncbi:DUF2142 domain-containing protein [Cronobacter sakazakii]|nr:DUF2142 domain-containing protein [Cronobacter sakazakii]
MKSSYLKLFPIIISAILAFIAISYVTPPFMSPDEPHHFSRAYLLTNGVVVLDNKEGMKSGGYIDRSLNESLLTFNNGHVQRVTDEMMADISSRKWSNDRTYKEIPNTAFYFPAVYVTQSIGIFIGKALNLSILETYHLSRTFTFLACIAIILYANSVYRIPYLAMGVMLMPMMLFQFSSATIDGITTSLAVLMMCLFAKSVSLKRIDNRFLVMISAIAFILVSSRANLIPILLLPFVASYYSNSKYRTLPPAVALILSLAWIGLTVLTTKDGGVNHPGISQGQVLSHYITHPVDVIVIIYNTISDYERVSSYFVSFVGRLGWLDILLPFYVYVSAAVALVALIAMSFSYSKLKDNLVLFSSTLIASFGSVVLIFCALLVQYSSFPTQTIIGIQGRYFVIPVVIASFLLMNEGKKRNIASLSVAVVIFVVSIYEMIPAIINRYYM